ncbi:hypothetical protein CDO73_03685 [Saccharibacillus sp. O23]|uniref:hypothetical protein n=1 Tax=Saccharibacillus sp. O23 TaxID=2009338 RepID=UPI000B4E5C56|nr:hypothetical protein [Saccharibacillus sp. O23]OWR32713.1 hypothetical protein CDO73_03685 [Saccharibacillus sp. O23]
MERSDKPREKEIDGAANDGWQEWYPEEDMRKPESAAFRRVLIVSTAVGMIGLLLLSWVFGFLLVLWHLLMQLWTTIFG